MRIDGTPICAVLFDLDGTLVARGQGRRKARLESLAATPEVIAAVHRVSRRCRIGIVTDGGSERQRAKLAASGLADRMAAVVISGDIRAQKPAPRIFREALAELDAEPAQTLFVGDDLSRDIGGARAAGMKTCWVSNGRRMPDGVPAPDLVVRTVAELPEALGC